MFLCRTNTDLAKLVEDVDEKDDDDESSEKKKIKDKKSDDEEEVIVDVRLSVAYPTELYPSSLGMT